MPDWWPRNLWRPNGRTPNGPEQRAVPASPIDPAWRHLPVLQCTVEAIQDTARCSAFAAGLTTAQRPALTGTVQLLSTGDPKRLPVLDTVRGSLAAPPPESPIPAGSSQRSWAPSPAMVQRALRGTATPVQRVTEEAERPRHLHPVADPATAAAVTGSFVDAPQPPIDRPLDAVSVADSPAADQEPDAETAPTAGVDPFGGDDDAVPARPAPLSTVSDRTATPLRSVTAVQRAVGDIRRAATPAAPLPIVQRTHPADATFTTAAAPLVSPAPADPHQPPDETVSDRGHDAPPDVATGPPPVHHTADTVADGAGAHRPATPDSDRPELPIPIPLVDVQRSTTPVGPSNPEYARPPVPEATPAPTNGAAAQIHTDRPAPHTRHERPSTPTVLATHAVQRVADQVMSAARQIPAPHLADPPLTDPRPVEPQPAAPAPGHTQWFSTPPPSIVDPPTTQPSTTGPSDMGPSTTGPSDMGPSTAASSTAEPPALQRVLPPVLQRAADPAPSTAPLRAPLAARLSGTVSGTPAPGDLRPAAPAVVQRVLHPGRVLLMPPVGSASREHRSPTIEPAVTDGGRHAPDQLLFESRPPMSLQRMFERTTHETPGGITVPPTDFSDASAEPSRPDPYGHHPEPPSVQRDSTAEAAPIEAPTQPAAPAQLTAAPPPASTPAAGDIEDLVDRLYDPLVARLRAELWLDRERAGALMDLRQ